MITTTPSSCKRKRSDDKPDEKADVGSVVWFFSNETGSAAQEGVIKRINKASFRIKLPDITEITVNKKDIKFKKTIENTTTIQSAETDTTKSRQATVARGLSGDWALMLSKKKEIGSINISEDLKRLTFHYLKYSEDLSGSHLDLHVNKKTLPSVEYRGECSDWGCVHRSEYEVTMSLRLDTENDCLAGEFEASSDAEYGPEDAFGGCFEFVGTRLPVQQKE
jgi:hypothetical protein